VRLEALAPATPETTTSLIKALARRFADNFGGSLALTGTFRAFGIAEIFFFSVVPTDFVCAVDDFFAAGLAFLRAFAARFTLLSYLRFSSASFSSSFCSWNSLVFTTCAGE
jgi:hypothetical protein